MATAADHPFAGRAAVPFAALQGEPVVHYHPDNGLGGWLDEAAAQLAAAGLGVALVPVTAIGAGFARAVRHLEPTLHRDVVLLTATPSDSLVRRFSADLVRRGIEAPAALRAKLS